RRDEIYHVAVFDVLWRLMSQCWGCLLRHQGIIYSSSYATLIDALVRHIVPWSWSGTSAVAPVDIVCAEYHEVRIEVQIWVKFFPTALLTGLVAFILRHSSSSCGG